MRMDGRVVGVVMLVVVVVVAVFGLGAGVVVVTGGRFEPKDG